MYPENIVSTDWLANNLNDRNLRVVDIRGHVLSASELPPHYFNHHDDYVKSHIPGAVFVDWVKEITDPDDPRHARIASSERFAAAMSKAGIDADTFVVTYDDNKGMFAARLWWALNYYGHSKVAVLDGGWVKWMAENRPTTNDIPEVMPVNFVATPTPGWHIDGETVLTRLDTDTRLIDMRGQKEFDGEASRVKRMGHIPGSSNLPRRTLVAEDETLLPADQLIEHFASVGVEPDSSDVVFYCNAGVSASFGLLASKVAGVKNAVMYDGSWKDWGSDESKPIET